MPEAAQKNGSETCSQRFSEAELFEIDSLIDSLVETALDEYGALEAVSESLRAENARLEQTVRTVQEKRRFWQRVSLAELCVITAGVYGLYKLRE